MLAGAGSCQLVSGCSGAGPEGLGGRGGRGGGVWRDVRPWAPRAKCLRPLVSFWSPVYRVRLAWGSCSPSPGLPASTPLPTASLPVCPEQWLPERRTVLGKTFNQ